MRQRRSNEGGGRGEVEERQARWRQVGGDAEERWKAVTFLVLDAVMFFVAFAAPGCSVCLV